MCIPNYEGYTQSSFPEGVVLGADTLFSGENLGHGIIGFG
jgi:hypothetical protein